MYLQYFQTDALCAGVVEKRIGAVAMEDYEDFTPIIERRIKYSSVPAYKVALGAPSP